MDKEEVNSVSNDLINNARGRSGGRPKMVDVNTCLTCRLCTGYLVDAVTITDCLHTFCRSCILQHLRVSSNCPECNHAVSILPSEANLLHDQLLQDVVYKLVPGLYRDEKKRQMQLHLREDRSEQHNGSSQSYLPKASFIPEQLSQISLILERTACTWSELSAQPCVESASDHIYLLCSSNVTVSVLKKLIHHKMNVVRDLDYTVWIYYADEFLKDYYSLQDIAEMCNWQMMSPLNLFYMILGANEHLTSVSDILQQYASAVRLQNCDNKRLVVKIALKRTRSKKKSRNRKHRGSLREVVASDELCSLSVGGRYEDIRDSPQMIFSSKSPIRNHQKTSTFSGTESERNKILSTTGDVGVAMPDSFSQKTTTAEYNRQKKLKSLFKKEEMLLTKHHLQSSPSSETRHAGSVHNLDSSDIDAKHGDCNSSENFRPHKSHTQDFNTNGLLPFKKRRRTLFTEAAKTSVCDDTEFVSTATPDNSKTSGSHDGGLRFSIYEDAGKSVSPPPKVGVIISRGRAMTLQDRQKMLSTSSKPRTSNLLKTFSNSLSKAKAERRTVCPQRGSESENLGEGKTMPYSQRNKKSKERKIKHAVECNDSDFDHYQTLISLKNRSALRVRGNIPVNQTESTAS